MWDGRTRGIARPPIAAMNRMAAALAADGADLINLGQAVLGMAPPPGATAAVRALLEDGDPHSYSPDPGLPPVLDAVAAFLRDVKGVPDATPDRLMLTCGCNQAFADALFAITEPGDEVVILGPYYFDHVFTIHLAGCVPVEVPLVLDGDRWAMDPERVVAALTTRTRALVVVSPANPTGHVIPAPILRCLADACDARGIWLLSDETYDLLTFPPAAHATAAGLMERVVVLGSFSKILGLAGWRVGYLLGSAALIQEAIKVQDALVVCAPVASQHAVLGALPEAAAFAARAREELVRRRDALLVALRRCPALTPTVPDGATFIMARVEDDRDDVTFAEALLRGAGLVTVPGSAFGTHGAGWLRLSYGSQPVARLAEVGERLETLGRAERRAWP
ncbi:MAG: pyridoxal phosphate-dependent aminotransferase [Pseudomonadota bacterium]